ncbi:MAG TPA: glycosyltransferase family 2 protein [Anaerolineales bacterium]|nr:glycosyltransferase family 2 protein [Anaerolineales bacterium]
MIENRLPESFTFVQGYNYNTNYEISLVIPTRNEAGNIEPLLMRLHQVLKGIVAEVLFVDDSTDDTPEVIARLQEWFPLDVRLIARPPERRRNGLGGAVVEGFQQARGNWVCVMDADLQHPPEVIPQLLYQAKTSGSDLIMGSRLAIGGDASSLGVKRMFISQTFAWTTRLTFPQRLRSVTDPLTGFFLMRRSALKMEELKPDGFKILLEILVSHPELKVSEVPIHFGHRHAGESKASVKETIKFFRGLFRLRLAGQANFVRFLLVGLSGVVVNSLALTAFTELAGIHYVLSAAIATQVSTLWNFGWTESWVFGRQGTRRSLGARLASFLLMNNAMLLLRGPFITLLVGQLGVHYVLSNLLSLFAMTLLRYLLADKWIWHKTKPVEEKRKMEMSDMKPNISQTEFGYNYDIHNILKVASMYELPELEYFRVPSLSGEPDIRLRLERRRRKDRRQTSSAPRGAQRRSGVERRYDKDIRYGESLGRFGFEISIAYQDRVEVAVSPILQFSPHVLYTNVIEPILRWSFVRKGYALVHAACVAMDGRAILVTARTDTGKTSTILRTVDNYTCSFLSDDMTIVGRDGTVLSYPKPLTISNHTLSAVNANSSLTWWERIALQFQSRLHSKSGRKVGLNLSKSRLPAATMNAIVQMLVPPPKYMVHRLIPKATYANQATLSGAVIIERGPEFEEKLNHKQAVETFVNNAEDAYGFPPYPILADALSRWNGEDLHPQEQAIVDRALKRISTVRLRDPKFNWWQKLPMIAQNASGATMQPIAADD